MLHRMLFVAVTLYTNVNCDYLLLFEFYLEPRIKLLYFKTYEYILLLPPSLCW